MNVTVTVIINAAIAARVNIVGKPPAPSYNQAIEGTAAAETVKDKTYFSRPNLRRKSRLRGLSE